MNPTAPATLYSIHLTKKIPQIRGFRTQCEQHFVYLNSDQLRTVDAWLSKLLDHELIMRGPSVTEIKGDEITPFDKLEAALSELCFHLPLNATPDEISKARSKGRDAKAASAGQRAESELMQRLRREREKEEQF